MQGLDWLQSRFVDGALIVEGKQSFDIISSSLWGGGFQKKRHLVNIQVPLDYGCEDAVWDVEQRVRALGLPPEDTAAMMTAAYVHQVAEESASGEQFALRCYVTAGVSNAARAGVRRPTYPGYRAGTINIIVVIDGRLTAAALVNAVITVTEAKTAALQELGIREESGLLATGTTTDAVTIAATQREQHSGVHQYAGVATELGCAMAEAVYRGVLTTISRYLADQAHKLSTPNESHESHVAEALKWCDAHE